MMGTLPLSELQATEKIPFLKGGRPVRLQRDCGCLPPTKGGVLDVKVERCLRPITNSDSQCFDRPVSRLVAYHPVSVFV